MIPWKSGVTGMWTLTDQIEEIYLDDYAREQVHPCPFVKLTTADQVGHGQTSGVPRSDQQT